MGHGPLLVDAEGAAPGEAVQRNRTKGGIVGERSGPQAPRMPSDCCAQPRRVHSDPRNQPGARQHRERPGSQHPTDITVRFTGSLGHDAATELTCPFDDRCARRRTGSLARRMSGTVLLAVDLPQLIGQVGGGLLLDPGGMRRRSRRRSSRGRCQRRACRSCRSSPGSGRVRPEQGILSGVGI